MTHFEGGIETKLDNATKRITYVNEVSLVLLLRIEISKIKASFSSIISNGVFGLIVCETKDGAAEDGCRRMFEGWCVRLTLLSEKKKHK